MSNRHDWNAWDHYLQIHERRLSDFDFFIVENRLEYVETAVAVSWSGTLICQGGVKIDVNKLMDLRYRFSRPQVRTRVYSYHVYVQGDPPLNLFRYDNVHAHAGHADPHHRHTFDAAGREAFPVTHMGEAGWPTLSDVIAEAIGWWTPALRS